MANPPVPSVDPVTGKLPDLVIGELRTRFASRAILNVYDFGAVDTSVSGFGSVSSQAALDAVMAAAETQAASGDRVCIQIPYGSVRGNFNVKTSFICFAGPGTLLDGEILYKSATANELKRFYSTIYGLGMRASNPGSSRVGGVHIVGGAFVEIFSCKFQDMEIAVHSDTWPGVTGQQNKTISVHDNQIVNVDYGLRGTTRAGGTWDAHADIKFYNNIVRHAYLTHVLIDGCDGVDIENNVMFSIGYQSTDTFHLQQKLNAIQIGYQSNFINIIGNKVFEAGYSGIYLDTPQNALISNNQVIWCGQISQVAGIRVNTNANITTNNVLIDGNIIDEGTQHGIAITGNGTAANIAIPDTNSIRLFRATMRNVYVGPTAIVTNNIARIFVTDTVTAPPRVTVSQSADASRMGVVAVNSMYSVARRQFHSESHETTIALTKAVTASTAVTAGVLRSPAAIPDANAFVGRVRAIIKNYYDGPSAAPRVARYEFTVSAAGTTKTISNLQTAGLAGSSADGGNPAFVFTVTASGTLIATPQGATAGTFEITVTATEFMQVSYTLAEYNAIPLKNPL